MIIVIRLHYAYSLSQDLYLQAYKAAVPEWACLVKVIVPKIVADVGYAQFMLL